MYIIRPVYLKGVQGYDINVTKRFEGIPVKKLPSDLPGSARHAGDHLYMHDIWPIKSSCKSC